MHDGTSRRLRRGACAAAPRESARGRTGAPWLSSRALPRYEKLVHPLWIHERATSEDAAGKGPALCIVDVSWRAKEDYLREHIPGAIHLDTEELESPPLWNVVPADRLRGALLAKGITRDTLVVVYGREIIAAARVATILMYAGVEDVRLLDGGFAAWLAAGLPVEAGEVTAAPASDFGCGIPARPEYLIDTETAKDILADPDALLICTRTWAEFVGETSGYDYIEARGRIPGTVWGFSSASSGQPEDYRNPDHTMRGASEIRGLWHHLGFASASRLSFYCGTGWRASEVFFYAYVMGIPGISVYDGSWLEWSVDGANPIAVGDPRAP